MVRRQYPRERAKAAEYQMTKEDWTALKAVWDMATIICTEGVEALRQGLREAARQKS